MMFGDTEVFTEIAERLLEMYDLEDILEMNNLTSEDALAILIEGGFIGHPESIIRELEQEETEL